MCDINKNILKMFQSIGQAADYLKLTHIKANRTILGKHINTDLVSSDMGTSCGWDDR